MLREDFIKELLTVYAPVAVLSEKNDCKVWRLRNKSIEKDLILRSFPKPVEAYKSLLHIRCDHLPEVYDVFDVEDGQIVLEEFVDGLTVAQAMETGKYRYAGAKKVLQGVCRGLQVIHQRNIVHRDVKPENVMVTTEGRVVLIDLNASRVATGASKDTVVMGTVGYASPEQLGVSHSDARTDIYAAGVLLNVMLTGKHPTEEFAPGRAGRIVRKCTALHPGDRYQSAQKLYNSL